MTEIVTLKKYNQNVKAIIEPREIEGLNSLIRQFIFKQSNPIINVYDEERMKKYDA